MRKFVGNSAASFQVNIRSGTSSGFGGSHRLGYCFRRLDVDLAGPNIQLVDLDFFYCGASDDSSSTDVELGAVPGTLDGAVHQGAVRKRAAFVRAVIAESEQAL